MDPTGLTEAQAIRQREIDGPNELPSRRRRRTPQIAIDLLQEPMVFLLIACGGIYLLLGDPQEAVFLIAFLIVIFAITLRQESRAERSLEALRDLTSPRALVLRDGSKVRIPGRDVVRGDLAFVQEGDRIPADGELLSPSPIRIDESLLTGESSPVDKSLSTDFTPALVYAGTTLVRGQALIRIISVGPHTQLGKIGKFLSIPQKDPTQLELHTRKLVRKIALVAALLCAAVVVLQIATGVPWIESILSGLALAMAILPNELPAVLTIFLAVGAWRISGSRVLTRRLSAIENLGAATTLCVDKTGTLTQNRMSLRYVATRDRTIDLSTVPGFHPDLHELLEFGLLACRQEAIDPMDRAIADAARTHLMGTSHLHEDWRLIKEYPLTPELLVLSQAWNTSAHGETVFSAKGAPEAVLALCRMNDAEAKKIREQAAQISSQGARVLGVARARLTIHFEESQSLPESLAHLKLEWLGMLGLEDPLRPEVPKTVQRCLRAGIRLIMLTGDHPSTAQAIAKQAGLSQDPVVMTGEMLEKLSDDALKNAIRTANVFSRVTPAQKESLVRALKSQGEIVAMTGDGINDAPALRAADIGIAMGNRGTDVARESAALVLLDDDFGSIVHAIEMGRRIFANLHSALVYLLAVHIPIAGISILPIVLRLPLVLMPIHIAFLHLLIEPTCSVAFEAQPAAADLMNAPPRKIDQALFGRDAIAPSIWGGALILILLLFIHGFSVWRGIHEDSARALTFASMVMASIGLLFWSKGRTQNPILPWLVMGTIALLAASLSFHPLRRLMRFGPLGATDLLIAVAIGVAAATVRKLYRN